MAFAKVACVAVAVCLVVLSALHETEGAVTCGTVVKNVSPCINYLQKGGRVPPPCCGGIKSLASAAATPGDRKTACNCLKSAAGGIRGINFALAAGLPGKCGVNIPYKISPSTDCSKVN